jgi:hypothetical protein
VSGSNSAQKKPFFSSLFSFGYNGNSESDLKSSTNNDNISGDENHDRLIKKYDSQN